MNKLTKNIKLILFSISFIAISLLIPLIPVSGYSKVSAAPIPTQCSYVGSSLSCYTPTLSPSQCGNEVPSPLDPNCTRGSITLGSFLSPFFQLIPIIISIVAVVVVIRGSIKIMLADDAENRAEGFKIITNAVIGAVIFYGIWGILYFIEQLTGAQLLIFG